MQIFEQGKTPKSSPPRDVKQKQEMRNELTQIHDAMQVG